MLSFLNDPLSPSILNLMDQTRYSVWHIEMEIDVLDIDATSKGTYSQLASGPRASFFENERTFKIILAACYGENIEVDQKIQSQILTDYTKAVTELKELLIQIISFSHWFPWNSKSMQLKFSVLS